MYVNENELAPNAVLRLRARTAFLKFGWGKPILGFVVPCSITCAVMIIILRAAAAISGVSEVIMSGNFQDALEQQEYIYNTFLRLSAATMVISALLAFLGVGMTKFFIELARGNTPTIKVLFSFFNKWHFCAALMLARTAAELLTAAPALLAEYLLPSYLILHMILNLVGFVARIYIVLRLCLAVCVYADNPNDGVIFAIRRSLALMGNRSLPSKVFLLVLSFVPWLILASFTCGVGVLFVLPYLFLTFAHFYDEVRVKARNEM
ncbi:MAG: DUF975 family protein [Clostridia bacterium]|nr:DUF975 family protein [Clostridia bacterium]